MGVELIHFSLLLQLNFQSFLLESLLVSQSFSEVMPFELREVFEVPDVLGVETAFFVDHFLSV